MGLGEPDRDWQERHERSMQAAAELADLRFHWDDAYVISCALGDDHDTWQARSLGDSGTTLTASSARELREMIRGHYGTVAMASTQEDIFL